MIKKGINIWYNNYVMRKQLLSGQIAVMFILVLAVIFLLFSITLNIGLVSKRKNLLNNTCDAAILQLASMQASYANYLSVNFLDGAYETADEVKWERIADIGVLAGGIAITIGSLFFPPALPAGIFLIWQGYQDLVTYDANEAAYVKSLRDYFSQMSQDVAFREQAIYYAISSIVDDPVMVADTQNFDKDPATDKVSRLFAKYTQREHQLILKITAIDQTIHDFMQSLGVFKAEMQDFEIYLNKDYAQSQEYHNIYQLKERLQAVGRNVSFWDTIDNSLGKDLTKIEWMHTVTASFLAAYSPIQDKYTKASNQPDKNKGKLCFGDFLVDDFSSGALDKQGDKHKLKKCSEELSFWMQELEKIGPTLTGQNEDRAAFDLRSHLMILRLRLAQINAFLSAAESFTIDFKNAKTEYKSKAYTYTYSWQDKRGWHHVRIEISPFDVPEITVQDDWFSKRLILKNHAGSLEAKISRFDENLTPLFFAGNSSNKLWGMRFNILPKSGKIDFHSADACLPWGISVKSRAHWDEVNTPWLE